jgi:hypothetical protein
LAYDLGMTSVPPDVPEFDTWIGDDGRLRGRHRSTGREISAHSESGLHLAACAVRMVITWQRAEQEERFTTGDLR